MIQTPLERLKGTSQDCCTARPEPILTQTLTFSIPGQLDVISERAGTYMTTVATGSLQLQDLLYAFAARRPGDASRVPFGMTALSSPGRAVELRAKGTWDRHCIRAVCPTPLGDTIDLADP